MDNKKVSIMMQKTNKSIQEFDINNPRFDWVQSPTEGQMTLNLLLTALDQTLTANSKKIPPPRGLSSINKLGLKRAIFSSRSGKYTAAIYCEIDVPEFDFLPLDLTTVNNTGYVHYYTNTNVTVHILGEVLFEEGQRYHTHFKKDADSDEYKVFLTAHQGVKLSFEAIKKVVFPTISTESDKILSDDSNSLKLLSRFNIEEENVSIRNPVIEIRLVPYLFYRVNGMLSSGMTTDKTSDVRVLGNFINLDGTVFSYMTFTFANTIAESAFESFFNIKGHDGGYKSLKITGFELISTNRDFDMNRVSQFADDDIDIITSHDIIAKKGVSAKTNAELIDDCKDYTFCRLVKENLIYSKLQFEGPVRRNETVLSSPIDNFNLQKGVSFADSKLQLIVYPIDNKNLVKLSLEGELVTITEDDRAIALKSKWDFGDTPNGDIKISGEMGGIYDNVFKIGLLDISKIQTNTTIHSNGQISDFTLKGVGIFGYNCYVHQPLVNAIQDQDNGPADKIIDLSKTEKAKDNTIPIVNTKCKDAYVIMHFDHYSIENNRIRGVISFKNPEDVMRTTLDILTDDNVPSIIRGITFPYGLSLNYTYADSKKDKAMIFTGQMDFMGVNTLGQYDLFFWNHTAQVVMKLPTVKMGGGNFQFIAHEDLFHHFGLNEKQPDDKFDSRNLDIKAKASELKKENTLRFRLEKNKLGNAQLLLEANILIFNMVDRVTTYLNKDLMSFTLKGRPFKGVFEATTTVEIIPVASLQEENNSVLKMTFNETDNFKELGQLTNKHLQTWVSRVIKVTQQAKILKDKLKDELLMKKAIYIPSERCDTYEQCDELPTIICAEYAQTAECIREKKVCKRMIQTCSKQTEYCTRKNVKGECKESIVKWDKWENVCENDETTTVWVEFENKNIPDHWLIMELVCRSTKKQDQEWVAKSQQLAAEIKHLEDDIAIIDDFLRHIKQLKDSSVCVLKRSKAKNALHECSDKDEDVTEVEDNIEILNLFEVQTIASNMQLRKVIASDEIIFNSKVWLYGDWTNKQVKAKDELVVRKDLQIEEENVAEGYTNGAKSLINVKHSVDFNSVQLTAIEIYDAIRRIVCKEYGIQEKESDHIQTAIVEFALLDGNSTICPPFIPINTTSESHGLYSESKTVFVASEGKNIDTLKSYTYDFTEGRKKIDLTKEQIEDYNTLDYQKKKQNPQDMSVVEAVLDDTDKNPQSDEDLAKIAETNTKATSKTKASETVTETESKSQSKEHTIKIEKQTKETKQETEQTQKVMKKEEVKSDYVQQISQEQIRIDNEKAKKEAAEAEARMREEQERQRQALLAHESQSQSQVTTSDTTSSSSSTVETTKVTETTQSSSQSSSSTQKTTESSSVSQSSQSSQSGQSSQSSSASSHKRIVDDGDIRVIHR